MPELPEVETVVRELNSKLKNRKIRSVFVSEPKIISMGPDSILKIRKVNSNFVKDFSKLLKGCKVISVQRRAKLIIFNLSKNLKMLVHLKMTGQFIFEDKDLYRKTKGQYRLLNKLNAPLVNLPSKHTHIIFNFTDLSKLYFNDVRKFGYVKLVLDSQMVLVKELANYGPEPLSKNFSFSLFLKQMNLKKNTNIKTALMDPKIIAGIGNIYSDEILFHSGILPVRKVASLKDLELRKIYINIKQILLQAIKAKGSSVGDFITTDGSSGKMGKFHYVYGKKGQKCKKCGSMILSLKINGRTASFCQKCQK